MASNNKDWMICIEGRSTCWFWQPLHRWKKHTREYTRVIPGCGIGCDFEGTRVADKLVQDTDYLFKLGPVVPLLLPAVQHQLVEGCRAVHGWGQAVPLVHSFYYLHISKEKKDTWKCWYIYSTWECFIQFLEYSLHLHPDWTFPNMAALHMTSLPRVRCHNSKHRWLM